MPNRPSDADLGAQILAGWQRLSGTVADGPRFNRRLADRFGLAIREVEHLRDVRNRVAHPGEAIGRRDLEQAVATIRHVERRVRTPAATRKATATPKAPARRSAPARKTASRPAPARKSAPAPKSASRPAPARKSGAARGSGKRSPRAARSARKRRRGGSTATRRSTLRNLVVGYRHLAAAVAVVVAVAIVVAVVVLS